MALTWTTAWNEHGVSTVKKYEHGGTDKTNMVIIKDKDLDMGFFMNTTRTWALALA